MKNIYDLAGNVVEWTSEPSTSGGLIFRGGSYDRDGSDYPVSERSYDYVSSAYVNLGFRPRLYIK